MISRLRGGLVATSVPAVVAVCRAGALPKWVAEDKEEPTAGPAVDSTYLGLEKAVGGDDNGW
jgi:hypothetical protein